MRYAVKATPFLMDQLREFDEKTRRILYNKIDLVETNPFRNKAIRSKSYTHVFRIRFSYRNEEKRLIYVIFRGGSFCALS